MMWALWISGFVVGLIPAFSGVYNGATLIGFLAVGFATVGLIRKANRDV